MESKVEQILRTLKNRPTVAAAVVVGIIIIGISAFTDALQRLWSLVPEQENPLELVVVRFIEGPVHVAKFKESWLGKPSSGTDRFTGKSGLFPASGLFPLLDVIIRNTGKEVILIDALEVGVRRNSGIPKTTLPCTNLAPTWEYNLLLFDNGPEKIQLDLAQVIDPNKADRFIVTIGQTQYIEANYALTFSLRFNEDEILDLGQYPLTIYGPPMCEQVWKLDAVRRTSPS